MAQRYNTGNSRPSNSMKDLNDNALANDDYMNSEGDTSPGGVKTEGYAENDQIRNVCYVDDYAYPNLAMLYDGGGIRVNEHNGSKITLPESFIIPASCTKQLVRMWFKLPTSDIVDITVLYNNQLLVIGRTYASNQSLSCLVLTILRPDS